MSSVRKGAGKKQLKLVYYMKDISENRWCVSYGCMSYHSVISSLSLLSALCFSSTQQEGSGGWQGLDRSQGLFGAFRAPLRLAMSVWLWTAGGGGYWWRRWRQMAFLWERETSASTVSDLYVHSSPFLPGRVDAQPVRSDHQLPDCILYPWPERRERNNRGRNMSF